MCSAAAAAAAAVVADLPAHQPACLCRRAQVASAQLASSRRAASYGCCAPLVGLRLRNTEVAAWRQVLRGLSFVVEPRTKVAFVGKAGCGKSTSVTLVQRFYNASKGSIRVDGRLIEEYDVHHLRRHIGVVAQDNILFSTSIIENIVYGMGQVGADAELAARTALTTAV